MTNASLPFDRFTAGDFRIGRVFSRAWSIFSRNFVTTPVCVVERVGPFRSLGRSRQLTKGHRWRILGLVLLIAIPGLIVGAIVGVVTLFTLGPSGFLTLDAALTSSLDKLVGLVWKATWGAFFAAAIAVTYHDLRVAKEGLTTEQIAAVFE
jgi:hypothetical protein